MPRTRRGRNIIAALIVIVAVGSLLVVPLIAAPILFIFGFAWSSGPKWARVTLVTVACLFGVYFLLTQPA
jgi:protein-S-isoprenylcysteine O-methyltransferase Ste14